MPFSQKNATNWYFYVVETVDGFLYAGITTDVRRRFLEHRDDRKRGAKFFRGHEPRKVVFRKKIGSRSEASSVEWHFKKLSRPEKEKAIRTKLSSM